MITCRMAVREAAPLSQRQWDKLQELVARGPTKKQLEAIADAKESTKNIK